MAVSSTSSTPSPTTATVFVLKTVTAQLLVAIPSLTQALEILFATQQGTTRRHVIDGYMWSGLTGVFPVTLTV